MTREELKEYCDVELKNIVRIREELFSLVNKEKSEYSLTECAAISTFIMNIYLGIENILKQILMFDGLDVKDAPQWHEKVLKKAGEIGILPPDLFQILTGYLYFRNLFIYSYVFNIKWEKLKELVDTVKDVIDRFSSEVNEYIQTI